MTKPIHPIRKMRLALERAGAAMPFDPRYVEPVLAGHVKPLLDALGREHGIRPGLVDLDKKCSVCRLLAAWRAKL